ncbi:MAG: aminopeptidase P family N-terminal domain-containing protein [Deltaproteobacteria bacterium]|nr:aminopeptidase P family N-terminal domain-containing protein [Deltaproteobacteria bacterium]
MPVPNDYWPPFSPGEYARRHRLIRDLLARQGLDALVIYGTHHTPFTDPGQINITWAAGYAGFFHSYLVFPAAGEPSLVIPLGPWHLDNARELSAIPDVRGDVDVVACVIDRLRALGLSRGRLGIVGTMEWIDQSIPWRHHERLRAALPEASLELVSKEYEDLRVVKSPEELAVTERAAGIADEAHEVLNRAARPGVTNTDLFNAVLAVVHERGGRINMCHLGSTSTLNPDMFYADPLPVNRPLQAGDVILTELCAGVAGYFAKI